MCFERTYGQAPDYTPELGDDDSDDDKKDIVRRPRHARPVTWLTAQGRPERGVHGPDVKSQISDSPRASLRKPLI